jgi:hypothetical protein
MENHRLERSSRKEIISSQTSRLQTNLVVDSRKGLSPANACQVTTPDDLPSSTPTLPSPPKLVARQF